MSRAFRADSPIRATLESTSVTKEIKLDGGDEYLIMREDDVLAVVEKSDIKKKTTKTKK